MRLRVLVAAGILLIAAALTLSAQHHLTGEWEIIWGAKDSMKTERLTLEQNGATLTGKLYSGAKTFAPITGKINGTTVEFGVPREQARIALVPWFTGTTDGKSMKGNVALGPVKTMTFTASRK